jgi:acyl dehydratase
MGRERVLSRPPAMMPLFARAGAAMIPGAARLPLIGGGRRAPDVPDTTLVLERVEVDRERLAAYDRVCGFSLRDELPCTYPHVLAFPLHLTLLTDPSFPFPALGLVHIANRIAQRRRLLASDPLTLRVRASRLEPHPRGRQFTLRTEARVGAELAWEEESTLLKRGSGGDGAARAETSEGPPELPVTATWQLPLDLGRRYSAVSGDYNPIHIHPLSARLFGFPTAIAHGMWTKARCLAALEARLPERFTVEVRFRKPILLPATVQFAERALPGEGGGDGQGGIEFSVRGAGEGTPHLDGRVAFSA